MSGGPLAATSRVIHVIAPAAVGGLESVVQSLSVASIAAGHPVEVVALLQDDAPHPFVEALRQDGVPVSEVRRGRRRYLAEAHAVASLIRRSGAAIVHTHDYHADIIGFLAARWRRLPVVTTVHGFTGGDWKNRLYERLQRWVFRRFDAVVVVSRPLADLVAAGGTRPERIHLVPNAWAGQVAGASRAEARRTLGASAEATLIGWVGRFTPEKGPDVFVRAMPSLADLPVRAVMVGDGPALAPARDAAGRLGVAGRIAWPGLVPQAGRLLAAFDVFVLSSRTEGTPMVLFEAMAAGVPVVATSVGGVPDVVGEAEALLVPPDDPRALAIAVRAVLADPVAARARAHAADLRLKTAFAVGPWLDRYEGVYRAARAVAAGGGR